MPRAALSQDQVEEFREALCACATELFAEQGYEGVTLRALAARLGCSPMTPYRYFENKAEIFATVRSGIATRFADVIDEAAASHPTHLARLRALGEAYVAFALREPYGYRIMFELNQRTPPMPPTEEDRRSWIIMKDAVEDAVRDGALKGDPDLLAHLLWSGLHGLVALDLSGALGLGRSLDELTRAFMDRELAEVNPDVVVTARLDSRSRSLSQSPSGARIHSRTH